MRIIVITVVLLLCGCSSNPWSYSTPPGNGSMGSEAMQKPVVLLKPFHAASTIDSRWSGIAPEMQQSFTRVLLKTGKFEVVNDLDSAKQARFAYVIESKITDFMHTTDAPESVRRMNWLVEANDAVVALDITATDVHTGRVLFSDQIIATAPAGDKEEDQYGTLEFGSYLFWSTPLGQASTDVLNKAVDELATLRGSVPGVVRITSYEVGSREVTLSSNELLDDGGIYYIGGPDIVTGEFTSIEDDLGRPLRLRVEKHFFGSSSGWLLSVPAAFEQIVGATLSRSPLPIHISSEQQ